MKTTYNPNYTEQQLREIDAWQDQNSGFTEPKGKKKWHSAKFKIK